MPSIKETHARHIAEMRAAQQRQTEGVNAASRAYADAIEAVTTAYADAVHASRTAYEADMNALWTDLWGADEPLATSDRPAENTAPAASPAATGAQPPVLDQRKNWDATAQTWVLGTQLTQNDEPASPADAHAAEASAELAAAVAAAARQNVTEARTNP